MKKAFLVIALSACSVLQSFAQGTFAFSNNGANAPIYYTDPTTLVSTLTDATFSFDYIYSTTANVTDASLLTTSAGTAKAGIANGKFLGGTATIPNYTGTISVEIRGWQTAAGSYANALANNATYYAGTSKILQVALAYNPVQPATPTSLTGILSSFYLTKSVPEPTTIALGVMGLSLLVFRRRK